jgi:hypothetical protein
MVVVDATTLLLLWRPDAGAPRDLEGKPVSHVRERIEHLISTLEKTKTKIIVPTPALSEALVRAGAVAPAIVDLLDKSSVFEIKGFDSKAAIEVAMMIRDAIAAGDKRGGADSSWAKVKFDRQIVAIAKVAGAGTIYSDDHGVRIFAEAAGIAVVGVADLPLPPQSQQVELPLGRLPSDTGAQASADDVESQVRGQRPAPEDN